MDALSFSVLPFQCGFLDRILEELRHLEFHFQSLPQFFLLSRISRLLQLRMRKCGPCYQ